MSREKFRPEIIKEVQLLYSRGNTPKVISDFTGLSAKAVHKILKATNYEIPEYLKTKQQLRQEKIAEFIRIVKNKKDHDTIGKEIFEHMKQRHDHYRESWEADSTVSFNFPKGQFICIGMVADWHLGHEGVNYRRLESDMHIIANTPNMYVGFLGDSMDNFIDPVKHPEAVINAITSPKDQAYMLNYILSLLKKPDEKILFVTKDNHVTERLKKSCGVDWTNQMWSDLNVFYGGEEIVVNLTVGETPYKIVARHRYRGSSKIHLTAACKALLKNGKYGDADIVALAHNHEGATEVFHYRGIPRVAMQVSTYKLFDPFAKKCGFDEPNIFMPCVILNPYTKDYIVCTNIDRGAHVLNALNRKKA